MPSPGEVGVGQASALGQASAPLRQRLAAQDIELQIARATIEVKREQIDEARCSALDKQARLLATVDALSSDAAQLRERNARELRELLEEAECPICLERPAATVLLPCGHVCCCHAECHSSEVQECPVCSGAVKGRARLYGAIALLGEMMLQRDHDASQPPSCTDDLPRLQAEHAADVMQQLQGMQTRIRTTIKEKDEELEKITSRCAQEADTMKKQLKARDAHFAREREHHQAQVAALQAKVEALEQIYRAATQMPAMRAELEALRCSASRMTAQLEEQWDQKKMLEARMTEERRRWHAQGQEQRAQIEEAEKRNRAHEARTAEERSRWHAEARAYKEQIEEAENRSKGQEVRVTEERIRLALCSQTQKAQLETVRRKLDAQRKQAEEQDRVWKEKERSWERARALHEAAAAALQVRGDSLQQQLDNTQLELCGTQTELHHLLAEVQRQRGIAGALASLACGGADAKRELDVQREEAGEQDRVWKEKERTWERARAQHEAAEAALQARGDALRDALCATQAELAGATQRLDEHKTNVWQREVAQNAQVVEERRCWQAEVHACKEQMQALQVQLTSQREGTEEQGRALEERRRRSPLASSSGTTAPEDTRTEGAADAAAKAGVHAAFKVIDGIGVVGIVRVSRPCSAYRPCPGRREA